IHSARARRDPAENVAAANDDRCFDAQALNVSHVHCDSTGDGRVDPELLVSHQSLTGELEELAFVDGGLRGSNNGVGRHRLAIIAGWWGADGGPRSVLVPRSR